VAAIVEGNKIFEAIADLTEAELDKFRNEKELTAEDTLDMYNFLKYFKENFSQLFSQP
jgi:hypothetical protein